MRASDAWSTLGIAPTDDPRAVRRAYSAKLKAIDVDADPQGFIELRAAFETATGLAEAKTRRAPVPILHDTPAIEEPPVEEPAIDIAPIDILPAETPPNDAIPIEALPDAIEAARPPPAPSPPPPPPSPWQEAADVRARAVAAIERELRRRKRPPDEGAMLAACDLLLAPHALERIDHATDTEAWFAQTIVRHIPKTNPLIAPAIRAFGWHKLEHPTGDVGAVMERYRARRWLDTMPERRAAYDRLAGDDFQPPSVLARTWQGFGIRALLRAIDADHPALEADLNPQAVAWWRARFDRPRLHWGDWGAIVAVALFVWVALNEFPETKPLPGWPEMLGAAAVALGLALWRLRVQMVADREEIWDREPFTRVEAGAAAVSFALPLVAVAIGGGAAAMILLALVAGAATVLAGRRFEWGVSEEVAKRRRWSPLLMLPLWGVIAIDMPSAAMLRATLPLCLAAITAHALYFRVDAWSEARPRFDRWRAPALLALAAVAVVAGSFGAFGRAAIPVSLAAAPLLLLVQHVLTPRLAGSGVFATWGIWIAVVVGGGRLIAELAPKADSDGFAHALALLVCAIALYRAGRMGWERWR